MRITESNSQLLPGLPGTKSCDCENVIEMLLELWQAWYHDHFPGEPVPGTNNTLREEPLPAAVWTCPSAASFHSLVSCWWSPEKGDQHFPLCCPPWGTCRLMRSLLSLLFSQVNKPIDLSHSWQVMSSRPVTTFVTVLWTHLVAWCPS